MGVNTRHVGRTTTAETRQVDAIEHNGRTLRTMLGVGCRPERSGASFPPTTAAGAGAARADPPTALVDNPPPASSLMCVRCVRWRNTPTVEMLSRESKVIGI